MESVQEFLNHPHADVVLMVVGGLLTVIGFWMVVRKGLALLFALIIFGTGVIPLTYVFKGSDIDFLNNAFGRIGEAGSIVPGIRDDVLKSWCDKLD